MFKKNRKKEETIKSECKPLGVEVTTCFRDCGLLLSVAKAKSSGLS